MLNLLAITGPELGKWKNINRLQILTASPWPGLLRTGYMGGRRHPKRFPIGNMDDDLPRRVQLKTRDVPRDLRKTVAWHAKEMRTCY